MIFAKTDLALACSAVSQALLIYHVLKSKPEKPAEKAKPEVAPKPELLQHPAPVVVPDTPKPKGVIWK